MLIRLRVSGGAQQGAHVGQTDDRQTYSSSRLTLYYSHFHSNGRKHVHHLPVRQSSRVPHRLLYPRSLTVSSTGASGYVGGQILKELAQSHPTFTVTALVRDAHVADRISTLYPRTQIVIGSLDDADLVEEEASKASIILSTHVFCLFKNSCGPGYADI